MAAPDTCRPRHVGEPGAVPVLCVEPREIAARKVPERCVRLPGKRQDPKLARAEPFGRRNVFNVIGQGSGHRSRHGGRRAGRPRRRAVRGRVCAVSVPFHDDVGVGSREAERTDAGQRPAAGRGRPVRLRGGDLYRKAVPIDLRVRCPEVEMLRDRAPAHRKQDLDEARGPRRGSQMADVGLHRADEQRPVRRPPPAVDRSRCGQLGRVAQLGPGPVRFQIVHLRGRNTGPRQRRLDHMRLGEGPRGGQSRAFPVLVYGRPADYPPDPVAGRLRLAQTLENQHAAAFAAHEPVRAFVEGPALAGGRQHAGVREGFRGRGRQDHANPAGQRDIRLAALEARHGLMDRDQRRGAGGVHGDRRALEAEREGNAPGRGAEAVARHQIERRVGPDRSAFVADDFLIFVTADSGIDPGAAADQPVRADPRVLQSLPAQLQQQPLLRVERLRLQRRDTEERLVETVDVGKEGAVAAGVVHGHVIGKHLAHPIVAGTGRTVGHRVAAGLQQASRRRPDSPRRETGTPCPRRRSDRRPARRPGVRRGRRSAALRGQAVGAGDRGSVLTM